MFNTITSHFILSRYPNQDHTGYELRPAHYISMVFDAAIVITAVVFAVLAGKAGLTSGQQLCFITGSSLYGAWTLLRLMHLIKEQKSPNSFLFGKEDAINVGPTMDPLGIIDHSGNLP